MKNKKNLTTKFFFECFAQIKDAAAKTIFIIAATFLILPAATVYASDADSGFLRLINRDNPLAEDFVPEDLASSGSHRMRKKVRGVFDSMLRAMKRDGINDLYVQSSYRTFAHQTRIFNERVSQYAAQGYGPEAAREMTARSIAAPGTSEHQTGLALDVTVNGRLNRQFAETAAGKWIAERCHEFGFIIRYPEDKTHITGIIYEPWHLRYVGLPHSRFMKENNLCLEEYIDYLQENLSYTYALNDYARFRVYYESELSEDPTFDGFVVDISSDRPGDGARFVVTTRSFGRENESNFNRVSEGALRNIDNSPF